ncbi:MAG: dockerin type I repeat-containing protein [Candidatus Zixiibacteriota bacterium]
MTRKLSAMFLLSFVIVALLTASVFGATERVKPFHERASFPARHAPTFGFPADVNAAATDVVKDNASIALGAKTISNPDTLGFTTYGYQQNCTMGRQVEHRGSGYIHFDWMWQDDDDIANTNRSVYYQAYNLVTCPSVFAFAAGGVDVSLIGRAGYVDLDVDVDQNLGIPVGHESDGQVYSPYAYWDFVATGEPFALFAPDAPTDKFGWYLNNGTGNPTSNESIWPKVAYQLGTETVLHMVGSESGGQAGDPQTISYWRRVGGYGDQAPTAVWSDQHVIDTIMNLNHTVVAQYDGDKVAIVWNAPVAYRQNTSSEFDSQYENDIWYAVATDQGAAWAGSPTTSTSSPSIARLVELGTYSGGNITQYDPMSDYKAYCDISALITSDNNLHVVWGCREWTDTTSLFRRNGGIFHWSEDNTTIRQVVIANWDTGGTCYAHAWGTDVAKMSISECISGANAGNLYVLYTQFGSLANPCGDVDNENNVVNGYLYMTASDDGGVNWDRAQRVTNTPATPTGCIPEDITDTTIHGTCNSEYWGSMARFSRTEDCAGANQGQEVLDIVYINDKAPGGCVQTESGVWTINPVIWWTTPCRDVVYEPLWSDNLGFGIGECFGQQVLWCDPGGDTTVTFTASNPGLLVNNWAITFNYTDGSGWMSAAPSSGALAAGGATVDIDLTFTAPAGAADPSTWVGEIVITHDAIGSPREVPACLVVASNRPSVESAVIATSCKRLKIYNQGELVNNEANSAMDYIDDCDTFNINTTPEIYLYDGSPIISRIDGTDTLRFMAYSTAWTDPSGLRPLSSLVVDSSGSDYTFATSEFTVADSSVGFIVEYYAPKTGNCEFIIKKLKIFATTAAVNNVYVGEFIDWDVPSDTASNNGSDYDVSRNMIYQYGAEYDDSGEAGCGQDSDDRFAAIATVNAPLNAMTFDNATYVYSSGPYGNAAPMAPGATYDLMANNEGFSKYTTSVPESTYTDLSMLVTFGEYDLAIGDTAEVCMILVTVKTGLSALQTAVDDANTFIETFEICQTDCCVVAGDANNDGGLNIGDAVFLINHIFKGGPAPVCMNAADANHDCGLNIGDAVYLINHIFKGGAAPQCGCIN